MKKIRSRKDEVGLFETLFEGDGYNSSESLCSWVKQIAGSNLIKVLSGKIRISDDYDAPVQKDFTYNSAQELIDAVGKPDIDVESFYINGSFNGVKIGVFASVWGKKNLGVDAPKGFDAEGFIRKMGIE